MVYSLDPILVIIVNYTVIIKVMTCAVICFQSCINNKYVFTNTLFITSSTFTPDFYPYKDFRYFKYVKESIHFIALCVRSILFTQNKYLHNVIHMKN